MGASWLVPALVSLVPGVCMWWWGRELIARRDDADVPERLAALHGRQVMVNGLAMALLVVTNPPHAVAFVLLSFVSSLCGGYPARRIIFGERWGLFGYLRHRLALLLAHLGSTLLLMFSPLLIAAVSEPARWPLAAALGVVLLVWHFAHAGLGLALHGARSLAHAELSARFEAIAARSRLRTPRLYRGGPEHGRFAMMVSWPGRPRPSVMVGETLLAELDTDELAALYACDLAFLEASDARRWQLAVLDLVLIAAAVVGMPLLLDALPHATAAWLPVGWLMVVMGSLLLGRRMLDQTDLERDRRAVALSGSADALVRALVKQAELQKVPRRLPQPSGPAAFTPLARRLQVLGELATPAGPYRAAPAAPTEATDAAAPLIIASREPGRWVILEADRVYMLEGVPADTALEPAALQSGASNARSAVYGQLSSIALSVTGGTSHLVIVDAAGQSWRMPVRGEDVRRLQQALDRVDTRLGGAAPAKPAGRWLVGVVLASASMFAVAQLHDAGALLMLPALLVLVVPSAESMGALAAMMFAQAATLLLLAQHPSAALVAQPPVGPLLPLFLAAVGLVAARQAWRRRQAAPERFAHGFRVTTLGIFGVLAAVAILPVLIAVSAAPATLVPFLAAATLGNSAWLCVAGLAGALAGCPRRWPRLAAWPCAALALLPLLVGTLRPWQPSFQEKLVAPRAIPVTDVAAAEPRGEIRLDVQGGQLRLSPGGTQVAVLRLSNDPLHVLIADFAGQRRSVRAEHVAFLSDMHYLALISTDDGQRELRVLPIASDAVATDASPWSLKLPDERTQELVFDRDVDSWRVVSLTDGQLVRRSGRLGTPDSSERRWRTVGPCCGFHAAAGEVALQVSYSHVVDGDDPEQAIFGTLQALTPEGTHELAQVSLGLECVADHEGSLGFVCLAPGAGQTSLWTVSASTGQLQPIGHVKALLQHAAVAPDGHVLAIDTQGRLYLIDALHPERPARRMELPGAPDLRNPVMDLAVQPGSVAVLFYAEHGSIVRGYRLPVAPAERY